ncbi:MAG TPA: glycine cleavage system aminomethyltransferase GcvT, partial [Candidatus Hydrogenedentes bacterium]|nr:glycine cleavage system aminomethyltransferase GcvT [Candidatus Hydrogenedentota bacterium]
HKGRVVDFHGWGLPLQFSGIIEEHLHVRAHAGMFDCSHMGKFHIQGAAGLRALSTLVIGDLVALPVGKCCYTTLLREDAGIIDDCVALKLAPEELLLVTNAGPLEKVSALLAAHVPGVADISEVTAKIDIQGPRSFDVLRDIGFGDVNVLAFWSGMRRTDGIIVARAGYTGELGYELYVPADTAAALWRRIAEHPGVIPCGLGARDTLRTEMGYPLSGQDVTTERTPLEAGMSRFIAWHTDFPGKARLEAQRDAGGYQLLVSLRSPDRRSPRHGYTLRHDGRDVGAVTSGTFGPSVGCGIGLGYVPLSLARPGTPLHAGPREQNVMVETPPLYKKGSGRAHVV